MKKAVFFDIDGTLWDYEMQVPQSTVLAVEKLKKNGILTFICSGRSRAAIQAEEILSMGFDGIVAGCGTYVEYRGEEIFNYKIPLEDLKHIGKVLKDCQVPVLLEGNHYLYADEEEFKDDPYVDYLRKMLGDRIRSIHKLDKNSIINKMSAVCREEIKETLNRKLGEHWELIYHTTPVVEILPHGFSKATGVEEVCRLLEIPVEHTYAFGDGANDVTMLQYVGHGIAMGSGDGKAKAAADYVTLSVKDGGIYHGLKHFGLI